MIQRPLARARQLAVQSRARRSAGPHALRLPAPYGHAPSPGAGELQGGAGPSVAQAFSMCSENSAAARAGGSFEPSQRAEECSPGRQPRVDGRNE